MFDHRIKFEKMLFQFKRSPISPKVRIYCNIAKSWDRNIFFSSEVDVSFCFSALCGTVQLGFGAGLFWGAPAPKFFFPEPVPLPAPEDIAFLHIF